MRMRACSMRMEEDDGGYATHNQQLLTDTTILSFIMPTSSALPTVSEPVSEPIIAPSEISPIKTQTQAQARATSTATATATAKAQAQTTNKHKTQNENASIEVRLRKQLYQFNKKITKREPLDPTYKFLLQTSTTNHVKAPHIHKDKMYKQFGADLRERVESYMGKYGVENPFTDGRKMKIGRYRGRGEIDADGTRSGTANGNTKGHANGNTTENGDTNTTGNANTNRNGGGTRTGNKKSSGNTNSDGMNMENMRAAFTLRECKPYEQEAFIQAELLAEKSKRLRGGLIEEGTRKRAVKAMALGLQERERKKHRRDGKLLASLCQKMLQAEKKRLEKRKALMLLAETNANTNAETGTEALSLPGVADETREAEIVAIEKELIQKDKETKAAKEKQIGEELRGREIEEAKIRERQRERERLREEEEERIRMVEEREERMRRARLMETPQQALHRLYDPIFQALWDMEFFDGSNPFRIVINKDNCAMMGAPDYFDFIQTPMNLTYVREKVANYSYETLQDFFQDIELIISNALVYNSDPNNQYHKAANAMLRKYNKLKNKVLKICNVVS